MCQRNKNELKFNDIQDASLAHDCIFYLCEKIKFLLPSLPYLWVDMVVDVIWKLMTLKY